MDVSLSGRSNRRGQYVIFVCEFLAQQGQEGAGRLIFARGAKGDAFSQQPYPFALSQAIQ